eukprot:GHVU01179186.1.p3 GENE.GHVU01179186.1~~GHVU01179186.1.p3  ORF type:complete len:103 (+),score=1.31 GHVU01179186.1:489-797(+)
MTLGRRTGSIPATHGQSAVDNYWDTLGKLKQCKIGVSGSRSLAGSVLDTIASTGVSSLLLRHSIKNNELRRSLEYISIYMLSAYCCRALTHFLVASFRASET